MPRSTRSQSQHPFSPDNQVEPTTTTTTITTRASANMSNHFNQEPPTSTSYQIINMEYRTERRKIIALLKNWHVRVQNKLGFDATLEEVKQRWTRFLDIDLLMDLEELEEATSRETAQSQTPTTSQINEMFKDVVAFLEARQPCGSKLSESDHTYHYQGHSLELQPNQSTSKAASAGWAEGKQVCRKKVLISCNSFIATAAVLGRADTDIDLVDRLLNALAPPITAAELLFIDRRLSILSQHLKEAAPALVAPITPTEVSWERCYTQQGRPMIQVDGYLFYVCPRRKKVGKSVPKKKSGDKGKGDETVSYFRCITNRKGAPKCPVRIKLNCRNEIVFQNGRQHCHPPVDITRYSERADQRKLKEGDDDDGGDDDHHQAETVLYIVF
ncbi:hypothetical protein TYRP_005747 [Tyrophagus putrescentiae]|nr:hypothetical protein TYRP_005747 [Tyrophagus putrescentiae]